MIVRRPGRVPYEPTWRAMQDFTTLRDAPADAEIVSHQLMMRAGFIKRLGAGIYTFMPLGLRVILLDFNLAKISSARRLVPWTLGLGVAAVVIAWFAIY